MKTLRRLLPCTVLLWTAVAVAQEPGVPAVRGEPSAADLARARTSFETGVEALRQEDYPGALSAFQASWSLNPRPIVMFNIANCQAALFDYPAAIASFRIYLEVGAESEPADRMEDARGRIAELEPRVGQVVLTVDPPGAQVLVDGRDVGTTPLADALRLGPGPHVLELRRDGFEAFRRELTVEQGERVEVVAVLLPAAPVVGPVEPPVGPLEPTPEEPEDDSVVGSWWLWTIVGAVVVGGAVTAGVLLWPSDERPADDWVLHGP